MATLSTSTTAEAALACRDGPTSSPAGRSARPTSRVGPRDVLREAGASTVCVAAAGLVHHQLAEAVGGAVGTLTVATSAVVAYALMRRLLGIAVWAALPGVTVNS